MHKQVFSNSVVEAKHRLEFLGAYFDYYVHWMVSNGYSDNTIRDNIERVTFFGRYLRENNIAISQLGGSSGLELLKLYRHDCKSKGLEYRCLGVKRYLQVLSKAGVIESLPIKSSLFLPLTKRYVTFLEKNGNLAEGTIHRNMDWVEKFLRFLEGNNIPDTTFEIADIDNFIEFESKRLKRRPHRSIVSALRSFIRVLHNTGKMDTDFSCLISTPRSYKLQSLPAVLTWPEVMKVLNCINRSTQTGVRNYAIMLFLTAYGLRAGEVAQMKLDDIDWRKETIHIVQRKMGKDLWLPLIPAAGKAVLEYLKHCRPPCKHRELFLSVKAPLKPIGTGSISHVVRRHIQIAGFNPPQYGAHMIRHSFATHLIRQGASLKEIGDILGHRRLESTHIYTKTAVDNLREVALEVPEIKKK